MQTQHYLSFLVQHFGHSKFTMLQTLSPIKCIFIQFSVIHYNISFQECHNAEYVKIEVNELNVVGVIVIINLSIRSFIRKSPQ